VVDEVQEENSDQLVPAINAGKLILPSFNPEDLLIIQKFKARYSSFSVADCSCLFLAENLLAILLTGERRLRSVAKNSYRLNVHGILWVFEQLIEKKIITRRMAHTKLAHLMRVNSRLPQTECERLLKHWEKDLKPSE
jgi:predicted nucleic acid-binding protein